MDKWINGKHYDVDSSEIISYSENPTVLNFPKGYRFVSVHLMKTPQGFYFLHGVGSWGCHTIIPMDESQLESWLQLSSRS